MKILAALAGSLLFLLLPLEAYALSRILDVRHWSAPDHTRIVLDLSRPVVFAPCPLPDDRSLAWWIRGTVLPEKDKTILIEDRIVKQVNVLTLPSRQVRLLVRLVDPAEVRVFQLKKYLDKPDRLVIDLLRPDLQGQEKEKREGVKVRKSHQTRVVVIDPGHGGEDPGTVGPKGTREKDIVLVLGKKLKAILDRQPHIRAHLTRDGDYFISLAQRVRIAREFGADLFVSLHCNGSKKRYLRGSSVYCLSLKGASDVAAQLLAKKENASDLLGGTDPQARAAVPLDSILVDLAQTSAINNSLRLGGMALHGVKKVNALQFETPRQAGFAVLKAPDFPSILVECAYLTNPKEESLLKTRAFQDRLVETLAEGIKKFLGTLRAQERGMAEG